MTLVGFDAGTVDEVSAQLDLRLPNAEAVAAVASELGREQRAFEVVCDLATGVGKTYVAAGLIEYLARSGVRNIVIVTPGSTIQEKTVNNFTPGHPKFVSGLSLAPTVITPENFERGSIAAALDDESKVKLFVFTVQRLLKPSEKVSRKMRTFQETLGGDLYSHLQDADDLVVIADEHHIYNSGAQKFSAAVRDLDPLILVGLTATPHETDLDKVIYHYPLARAIADEYVKIPVLVGRDGDSSTKTGTKEQLADGVLLLDYKRRAVEQYETLNPEALHVNPVMFVVARTIEEANEAAVLLAADNMIGDPNGVLLVTSQSTDDAIAALQSVEDPNSPVRAIVAVDMLGLGWDVANIYVVVALRALESAALSEQILGRGLRLPYGERTGIRMLDTVEVVSHRKFRELLDNADALLENIMPPARQGADARENSSPEHTAAPSIGDESSFELQLDSADDGKVAITYANSEGDQVEAAQIASIGTLTGEHDIDFEHQDSIRRVEGAPEIQFPRLDTRIQPLPFSLTDVTGEEVAAVGRKFKDSWSTYLHREALDVATSSSGEVTVIRTVESVEIDYEQMALPVNDVESRLTRQLKRLDFVESSRKRERNAAGRIVREFLSAAEFPENGECDWSEAQTAAAVYAFSQMVQAAKRKAGKARHRYDEYVRIVGYPPPKLIEATEVYDKGTVGKATPFQRYRWYSGWNRCILSAARFAAKSTEWELAKRLDGAQKEIRWWVNIERHKDVEIDWADDQKYTPDFIAVDTKGVHWLIETKSDKDARDSDVIKRRKAAQDWERKVNDHQETDDKWRYLFITESDLKATMGWGPLASIATT